MGELRRFLIRNVGLSPDMAETTAKRIKSILNVLVFLIELAVILWIALIMQERFIDIMDI